MRQLEDVRIRWLGRQDTAAGAVSKHLFIAFTFGAVLVVFWMLGVLHEAPPLISN